MTQKLIKAEETLRNYAKQWETKQQSMKLVKSKLLKKKFATFGTGDINNLEIESTPYLISLSNDPMLNLAIKIYLPQGNTLRIGKSTIEISQLQSELQSESESELKINNQPPDLQIEGLGIEYNHCILFHDLNGNVLLMTQPSSMTYINGKQINSEIFQNQNIEDVGISLKSGDRIVLGICSHVFAFCDPKSNNSTNSLPTHEQAIREVILGRGETEHEKKERLAALVIFIYISFCYLIF